MNVQRISAIFEKDLKDFMKNTMLFLMPVSPILLAFLYDKISDGRPDVTSLYTLVGLTFASVVMTCIMWMMAEEHEKQTLRGLTQSPASFLDIIIGKSLVVTVLTAVSLAVSLLITGAEPLANAQAIVGIVLFYLFFLFLGISIGLFVKTVGATSIYSLPLMFLFGYTPIFQAFVSGKDSLISKVISNFPIMQLIKMDKTDSWTPIGIVAIWTLVAALCMYVCFRRTRQDD